MHREHLQDITVTDARDEGMPMPRPRYEFQKLWDQLHKPQHDWLHNPLVYAFTFEVHRGNIDPVIKGLAA